MKEHDMVIRLLSADDKESVMRLLGSTPEFDTSEVEVAEEVVDCYLANPGEGYQALVADDGGRITGFICFGQTPLTTSTWGIYWLAVDRITRSRGIGGALLRRAEATIGEKGGHLILIETSSKHNYLATRRFYRKKGYHRCCRIKDFYAAGDHLIIFEKRL